MPLPPSFDERWQQAAQAARRATPEVVLPALPLGFTTRVLAASRLTVRDSWPELLVSLSRRLVPVALGLFLAASAWLSWELRSLDFLSPDWLSSPLTLRLLLP